MLVLGLLLGAAVGVIATWVYARRGGAGGAGAAAGQSPEVLAARHALELSEVRAAAASANAGLQAELAAADATVDSLLAQIEAQKLQFGELAERHRADRIEQAERERRESAVLQALGPVRETLSTMQTTVTEMEKQRSEQFGSLAEQLKQAQLSDEQLRGATESLASALRSNSTRGVWGETQLRRVVEAAGLAQYVDFDVQQTITTDAGTGRPDMVIRLPGGKSIAVDAKVPLEHYLEASQIAVTATGEEGARRKALVDRHVKAVRGHIDALAKKTYWEGLDASPEFVVAFVPSESLLSSALEADPAILEYSFSKRVALASPVNLWAVLKTVAYTWQEQALTDDAKKLFELGKALYSRLGTLSAHADGLRKAIERTVDSYNKFANSLESRVLVTARQFPGIDETKLELLIAPAPIHEVPRKLTAVELELPEPAAPELPEAAEPALPEPVALELPEAAESEQPGDGRAESPSRHGLPVYSPAD